MEFSILYLKQFISSRNKFTSARIFSLAQKIVSIEYFCIKKKKKGQILLGSGYFLKHLFLPLKIPF